MSPLQQKLKIIFLPIVLTIIITVITYTAFHWALIVAYEEMPVKEDIIEIILPICLSIILGIIIVLPRLKILKTSGDRDNALFFYSMICCGAIIAPLAIGQAYVKQITATLINLNYTSEIVKHPGKYYTIKNVYIDKSNPSVYTSFNVSGKNNQYFVMSLYVVLPVFNSEDNSIYNTCSAWYGLHYSDKISNRLSDEEKQKHFESFMSISQKQFDETNVSNFIYLQKEGNTNTRDGYLAAMHNSTFVSAKPIILIPQNEPFEKRVGNKLTWIFLSILIGYIAILTIIVSHKIDKQNLRRYQHGKYNINRQLKKTWKFLQFNKIFWVTQMLIYVNLFIFLVLAICGAGFISVSALDLLAVGGNYYPSTTNGEWWRLLTSMFLHGGIMHLLGNIYGLYFVSMFLEPILGWKRFLGIYLTTGIIAGITSLWWNDPIVSVGASGAIFGLYGCMLALMATKAIPPALSKGIVISMLIFVGYNLVIGIAVKGIDNACHVGGLVSGVIVGFIMTPFIRNTITYAEDTD